MTLTFSNLSRQQSVQHFISTRNGGYSKGEFESLNLSHRVGDTLENVVFNRRIVSDLLGIDARKLFFPEQCHTSNIQLISKKNVPDLSETDALITAVRGIGIGVLAADCFPVLFFDPIKQVVAAAHAGWRGTVQLIVPNVVVKMEQEFGSNVTDLLIGIGPGISQMNYEVDEVVIDEVKKIISQPERFYQASASDGRYLLNLQELNKQLLIDLGVTPSNIELIKFCTFDNSELFFSARRDGFNTGRFGAVIALI